MFWLMGQWRMVLYQSWGVVGKAQEDTRALQEGVGWRLVGRDRNIMDFFFLVCCLTLWVFLSWKDHF